MKITRLAEHGVAGADVSIVGSGYAYHPDAGFIGKDSFAVSIQATYGGHVYPVTVNVDVDVAPAL
jgi:hypothetical protein